MEPLCICDGSKAEPVLGRLLLPSSITTLVAGFFCHHAAGSSRMATLPSFRMATRSLLGSSASSILTIVGCCHGQPVHYEMCSTGFTTTWTPHSLQSQTMTEIRQQIWCLWTCLESTIFAAVFVHITICNILQVHTSHAQTFPLNMSSGQGRHPLMFSQLAPSTGATPVFGAQPTLCFIDQLQK